MNQQSFSDMGYSLRKRTTKREEFLDIMDEIIPWDEWVNLIKPHYPNGKRGRPPKGIEKMLRMYLLQSWFALSDEGVEDAIYDSNACPVRSIRLERSPPTRHGIPCVRAANSSRDTADAFHLSIQPSIYLSELPSCQRSHRLMSHSRIFAGSPDP